MNLQLQTFSSLVSAAAAAVQGSARQFVDLSVGSTLRAMLEASASSGLWMQWLILQVLRTTRAATSEDGDLDSWVADFGLTRLPAAPAHGVVAFSRFVPAAAAFVSVGTVVRTADGSQTFSVLADRSHRWWSDQRWGFSIGAGEAEIVVPVVADLPGAAGNVLSGAVSLIASSVPGIDAVTNSAPLVGGLDAESDAALRARFMNFMDSRSRATPAALGYAIASVRQGLEYTLLENTGPDGLARMGSFTVTIDDGTGAPSESLMAAVADAIEAVRPVGSTFSVRRPTVRSVKISLRVDFKNDGSVDEAREAVRAAVENHLNTLPVGASVAWSRLVQVAYNAHPSAANVAQVLVDGRAADVSVGSMEVVKASDVIIE